MKLSAKRFLVIGGAGFIGSHIVDQLVQTDVKEIIVYDDFSRGSKKNLKNALKDKRVIIFDKANILDEKNLNHAVSQCDGVFHLAALWLLHCYEYPREAFDVNIKGTFNVIMACIKHKVERVVFSSSASVYGNALEIPMSEDHAFNNETFYGASKIAGEQMFKSLGKRYDLNWVGLRYMNVYGSRQDYKGAYTAVMMKILDRLDEDKPAIIYGDGTQQYDFIDVRDVARSNICAMQSSTSGELYNVGRGIGTSLRDIAELLIRLTNTNQKIEYKPAGLTFVTNRIGSTDKAKKEIDFSWSIDLEKGFRNLIDWRAADKKL